MEVGVGVGDPVERVDERGEVLARFDLSDEQHVPLCTGDAPTGFRVSRAAGVEPGVDPHDTVGSERELLPHPSSDVVADRVHHRAAIERTSDEGADTRARRGDEVGTTGRT